MNPIDPRHTPSGRKADQALDRAMAGLAADAPRPAEASAARERAWDGVARALEAAGHAPASVLHGCADFRALIPAAMAGELTPARRRLFDDHVHGCVDCRAELRAAKAARAPIAAPADDAVLPARRLIPAWRPQRRVMAIAASLLLALGLTGMATGTLTPTTVMAQVQSWTSQLMVELGRLRADLNALPRPEPRTSSALAAGLPADTVLFIALPNLADNMAQADALLKQRVEESAVLKQWWEQNMSRSGAGDELETWMPRMAALGQDLGEEIVIAAVPGADGEVGAPLIVAEVRDEAGLRRGVEAQLKALAAEEPGSEAPFAIVDQKAELDAAAATELAAEAAGTDGSAADADQAKDDAAPAAPRAEPEAVLWLGDGRAVLSPSAAAVQAYLKDGGARFEASPLHDDVAAAYAQGVNTLVAVDLQRMLALAVEDAADDGDDDPIEHQAFLGLDGARSLILAESGRDGQTDVRAEITFDGPRRGAAAWLADAGKLESLDFFSPEAHLAAAGRSQDPAAIFEAFLREAGEAEDEVEDPAREAAAVERLRAVAATLTGEYAAAMDGPVLPRPSWKLVVGVRDEEAFRAAFTALVQEGVDEVDADERPTLVSREVGGRTVTELVWPDADPASATAEDLAAAPFKTMVFLVEDGYFVAASQAGLLEQALRQRSSGINLRTAGAFTALLPAGADPDTLTASAILFQNLAPVAGPLAQAAAGAQKDASGATGEEAQAATLAAADLPPSLALVQAEADKIILRGRMDGPGLGLGTLLGGPGQLLGLTGGHAAELHGRPMPASSDL